MSEFISLEEAIAMTTKFRDEKENILDTSYQNQDILPRCETFERTTLDTLLAKPGCEAIRIYYGMDGDLKIHAILVPVNENNEDMLPSLMDTSGDDIAEHGQRCPDNCPPESDLNP